MRVEVKHLPHEFGGTRVIYALTAYDDDGKQVGDTIQEHWNGPYNVIPRPVLMEKLTTLAVRARLADLPNDAVVAALDKWWSAWFPGERWVVEEPSIAPAPQCP